MLFIADILSLVLFVLVGQREHDTFTLTTFALNWAVFALPWGITNWLRGGFAPAQMAQVRLLLLRTLENWLIAAPLGIVLRALVTGRVTIPTPFFLAAVGFGGLFVLGGRLLATLIQRAGQNRSGAK